VPAIPAMTFPEAPKPVALDKIGGLLLPFLNLFYRQRFSISDDTLGWIFGIMQIVVALMTLGAGAVAPTAPATTTGSGALLMPS